MENKKQRTLTQNRAIHLYFTHISEELNAAGLDMKKVLKPEIDISWTPQSVKEYLWRPVQKSMVVKKSTTELTSDEVTKIYEVLNRFLSEKHSVAVAFPSMESLAFSQMCNE